MKSLARTCSRIDALAIFVLSLVFYSFLRFGVQTDISAHIYMAIQAAAGGKAYPPNFGLYLLVNSLSLATHGALSVGKAMILVLSAATTAKYSLTKKIIGQSLKPYRHGHEQAVSALIALCLLFTFAIADPYAALHLKKLYLGRIVPNVWHNSTTILVFPFAILLFWRQSIAFMKPTTPSTKDTLVLVGLAIINAVIKPAFLLAYIPATAVLTVSLYSAGKIERNGLLVRVIPLIASALLLATQKYLIYSLQLGSIQEEASGLSASFPFEVMAQWVPAWYLPIGLLLSFAFPLTAIITHRQILKTTGFFYSLLLALFGLLVSAFLIENGPRASHGNFMWTSIICTYLLFMTTTAYLAPRFTALKRLSAQDLLLAGLFIAHLASGVLYIGKIILLRTYF